jgi:hypothetical protein
MTITDPEYFVPRGIIGDAHHLGFACLLYDWHQSMDSLKQTRMPPGDHTQAAIIPQTVDPP